MIQYLIFLLYAGIVFTPAIIAGCVVETKLLSRPSMTNIADLAAFVAVAILSMQFILSARLKWIDRSFGLDRVMLFHRIMAITAATLLLMHPLLLAADPRGDDGWKLLYTFSFAGEGLKVLLGKVTLSMLLTTAALSLFRLSMKIEYQLWLRLHDVLALSIIAGGFIHSLLIGPHVGGKAIMETFWIAYPSLALGALIYNRIIRAAVLKARTYRVTDVRQETDTVWTLTMVAPGNGPVYDYFPGQFHFLTLYRRHNNHHEQHPFTISSSPSNRTEITSSIKQSGDYTASIGKTAVGDRAALLGPFGRFSYMLHPTERNLVFIAGGIGITPFISMVRFMRETGDAREVLLLYGNRMEKDIAFRKELDEVAEKGIPRLCIIYVLDKPDSAWTGKQGRITSELIIKECKGLVGRVFYLCGPPTMMMGLVKSLKKSGVKRDNIRYERFSI
jgi:predicted ferric reductase